MNKVLIVVDMQNDFTQNFQDKFRQFVYSNFNI